MNTVKLSFLFFMFLFSVAANAQMILEYDIATTYNAGNRISLALYGTVNVQVDWGDGSAIESFNTSGNRSHTYATLGIKTVTITGTLTQYGSGYPTNIYGNDRLTKVLNWEGVGLKSLSYAFGYAAILTEVPTSLPPTITDLSGMFYNTNAFNYPLDTWNTSAVTNMSYMFCSAYVFNQPIGSWNTSAVTNMGEMFLLAKAFNQPLDTWNTSAVTNMREMFYKAKVFNQPIGTWNTGAVTDMGSMFGDDGFIPPSFNQPIGDWNTTSVTDMSGMFTYNFVFNQPIGDWNTSAVTNMSRMFYKAKAFNQPIGTWNTGSVTNMKGMFGDDGYTPPTFNQPIGDWNTASVRDMSGMFENNLVFNQPIGDWNTGAVTRMDNMFHYAPTFNQPIGNWNTAAVTDMSEMFSAAYAFNQPIGNWNTASVTDMSYMFTSASTFNQSINSWNTSAVKNMQSMFSSAYAFNQPIGNWNTAAVTNMNGMFLGAKVFNQPIENWNTSSVTDMRWMFCSALAFNQPLGNLNVTEVTMMHNMFLSAGLCTYNYDATLIGWSIQAVKPAVTFDGANSKYSGLGANARTTLISKGWTITDGGLGLTPDAKCDAISYYNTIRGKIYTDGNADCIKQITETPLPSIVVKAVPGNFYGYADSNGNYEIRVDTGTVTYTLTQQFNAVKERVLLNQCAASHSVSLKGAFIDTASFDFANEVRACTLPTVDIQHAQLIRCFRSSAYIQYCNLGNTTMNNATIEVEYPAHVIPKSSVPMWSSKIGSTLFYNIATLEEANCGRITIVDSVDCASQDLLGLTQCIKATITPGATCTSQSSLWDFSSTEVVGTCENNQAAFVLTNTGDGDMSDSLIYKIFVNDTLIYNGKYKLLSGSTLNVRYPAQAQTVRLEADQHPNHPGNSHPKAIVESCGVSSTGFVPKGLVTTTAPDDLDEEVAIVCYSIRGSFDPNDKQAAPTGVGITHQVAPGTALEYTIRFQNTGTAMAHTVKVIDTLDVNLDVSSFVQGVSSHAYTLTVTGKGQAVLTYTFNNINLPDSTTNKSGSNGLVSFRIIIPSDITLGTVIHNKAYIYFDYNDAILTNNTMHTVGTTTIQNLSKGTVVEVVNPVTTGVLYSQYSDAVKVYPNPSDGIVTLEMAEAGSNMELRITSVAGVLKKTIKLTNTTKQQVHLEGIHQGMYLYEIWKDGARNSVGTLQIW